MHWVKTPQVSYPTSEHGNIYRGNWNVIKTSLRTDVMHPRLKTSDIYTCIIPVVMEI